MTLRRTVAPLIAALLSFPAVSKAQETAPPVPAGPPTAVVVSGPELGSLAPDISLPWGDRSGPGPVEQPFTISAHRGSVVVLAFYTQDFTSGCTAESKALFKITSFGGAARCRCSCSPNFATPAIR